MRFLTKKSLSQKILIAILIALILIFAIAPNYNMVYGAEAADDDDDSDEFFGSTLLKEILHLIAALGDIVMSALNNFMLGADGFGSAMLKNTNNNLKDEDSWLYVENSERTDADLIVTYNTNEIDVPFKDDDEYKVPNMLYSPEEIFANNIAALDVNFLRPNQYTSIVEGKEEADEKATSAASGELRNSISTWYKAFRNIAIVGLLSVLVYLGIRILISSTSVDKAKYKESLQDWLVALCLVFVIHFIMSGILMLTEKFTDLVGSSVDDGIIVKAEADTEDPLWFRTNLLGLIRFNVQSSDTAQVATYVIIYLIMVIYTCVFTFMYFKRFLYMAFFTMIAPLVALTYPIDRARRWKSTSI